MPPKRPSDAPKDTPECILRIGKSCNIRSWIEEMETAVKGLYGLTGNFFTTNERYVPPFPEEDEYAPPMSDLNDDNMTDVIDEKAEALKSEEDRETAAAGRNQ